MRKTTIATLFTLGLGCQHETRPPSPAAASPTSRAVPVGVGVPVPVPVPVGVAAAAADAETRPTSLSSLPPLVAAVFRDEPPSVLLRMIADGADVNARAGKSTALYYVVSRVQYHDRILPVVKAMVERGADLEGRCIGGFTPLMAACEHGAPSVVEYLVSKGAKVNAKDDSGYTPLHAAAARNLREPAPDRLRLIRLLVAHGADVNAVDTKGRTPRDRVKKSTNDKATDDLLAELGGLYGVSLPRPTPGAQTRPAAR